MIFSLSRKGFRLTIGWGSFFSPKLYRFDGLDNSYSFSASKLNQICLSQAIASTSSYSFSSSQANSPLVPETFKTVLGCFKLGTIGIDTGYFTASLNISSRLYLSGRRSTAEMMGRRSVFSRLIGTIMSSSRHISVSIVMTRGSVVPCGPPNGFDAQHATFHDA
ncbi:hypothetical protein CROQUDRAFT_95170 [Cronartium quercuum f. sp. fusiforme G11]|uniref:Uncharacterized protein n=1 Tax=Cronartium quercuum f. sp. fusiforme G11 TaxID=708437 RepID=A0A9P6NCU5_9BASI|nr:hypothetical protein CROQUDRAFT_95170 [Cronartium quercuum f. sp. fusiforme G11]